MVSFNGEQIIVLFIHPVDQSDMIRQAILFPVKEDQIPRHRAVLGRRGKQLFFLKAPYPGRRGTVIRVLFVRDSSIVQAEGDKHRTPVAVRDSVPGSVSSPPFQDISVSVVIQYRVKVSFALAVAELGLCNRDHIFRPYSGQFQIFKCLFPDFHRFEIGGEIADRFLREFQIFLVFLPFRLSFLLFLRRHFRVFGALLFSGLQVSLFRRLFFFLCGGFLLFCGGFFFSGLFLLFFRLFYDLL